MHARLLILVAAFGTAPMLSAQVPPVPPAPPRRTAPTAPPAARPPAPPASWNLATPGFDWPDVAWPDVDWPGVDMGQLDAGRTLWGTDLPPVSYLADVPSLPGFMGVPPLSHLADVPPIEPFMPMEPMPPLPPIDLGETLARASFEADRGNLGAVEWPGARGVRGTFRTVPREAWAQDDPADSMYRAARELLNRGDWRRASAAFRDLQAKYPTSQYASDALYWQAFAFYRIGATTELRSALTVLANRKSTYPGARSSTDADALATRIRGALAQRGDPTAGAAVQTVASNGTVSCDPEEQAVRVEALSALRETDPDGVRALLDRILQRKDECSVPLRRSAVFLIASRRDAAATTTLATVARDDPSLQVRVEAVSWLSRMPGDDAVTGLESLTHSDEERIARAAVRSLVSSSNPKARPIVRGIVERSDVSEGLRAEALASFDKDHATSDDVTWLKALYPKLDSPRLKARALYTLARIGGDDVNALMAATMRNPDEPAEIRRIALQSLETNMTIADLGKLYDGATDRPMRQEIINGLGQRKEPEATDKLIDIVKNGTDPELRRMAISVLTSKHDPRTTQLLMEIIDK